MRWICQNEHTLLDELALKMPQASKSTLNKSIKDERVVVDECVTKRNISLSKGAKCEFKVKKKYIDDIEVYYEDRDIVVVEKPEGLLTVATSRELFFTLHAKLKKKFQRVWPVHRLDRETSGVLVFALNEKAREGLIAQFKDHSIVREYRAIVVGDLPESGVWKHRLVEDGNLKMHVTAGSGLQAETYFKRLDKKGKQNFVQFILKTGKKNQIRVQSSFMGFPILGDKKYANRELRRERMFLHAHHLGFSHPITKKELSFFSPIPFSIR